MLLPLMWLKLIYAKTLPLMGEFGSLSFLANGSLCGYEVRQGGSWADNHNLGKLLRKGININIYKYLPLES